MTDDIEGRRAALTAQLWSLGHNLGTPSLAHQTWRNAELARLQAALEALPRFPPPITGEGAGHLVIGRTLGSVFIHAEEPAPETQHHSDTRCGAEEDT